MSEHHWNDNHGEDVLYDPPKFRVFKGWKDPIEEIGLDGEFIFVLRPERDEAAWDALAEYASVVAWRSPNLASQIMAKLLVIEDNEMGRRTLGR